MVNADASGKGNSVFARSLAHTELAVREKAFARLAAFLAARAAADGKALERLDLLKIWKGLFYAFWHSDLAPIQAELAERIARLLMGFQSPKDAELYFATFLETMRREWYGIDKLRMDKFMMLVRKFMTRTLQYLDSLQWCDARCDNSTSRLKRHVHGDCSKSAADVEPTGPDTPTDEEVVEGFMEALATCGLEDQLTSGIGFALHLTDVWAPALAAKEVSACSAETLSVLFEPFVHCMAFHSNAAVLTRVQQEVLPGGLPELVESPHVGEAKVHQVRQLLAERIRQRAEDPEAVRAPKNRKVLYEVAKALDKAVKKTLKRGLPDVDTPSASTSSASASASAARSTAAAPSDDAEEHVAEPPKKKKKKAKAAAASEAAEAAGVPADVSGLAMPSADEWSDGALADDWSAAPMDTEDSPVTAKSEKKKKKKKEKERPSGTAADEPHTPSRASLKASSAGEEVDEFQTPVPEAAKKRKSVRISLKHNLEFPHKSKPLSPSVRTPLASRPKGPALKAVSKWPSPPQSAPAKPSRPMLGADERSPQAPATEHKKKKKKKSKEGREDGPGHTPGAKKYGGGSTLRSPTSPSPSPPTRRSAESFF